jgi:hypothetical protein
VFLSALARKLQGEGTLTDPVKLYGIAKAALANMQLSDKLADPTMMVSIAKTLKDVDLAKLAFIQYPTGYVESGAVAPTESAEIVNLALQNDTPVAFDPEAGTDASFASATDPNAATPDTGAAETPTEEVPAGEPTAEEPATDDAAAPEPTEQALPSDVTGQTAAETRCSAGRTLADQ